MKSAKLLGAKVSCNDSKGRGEKEKVTSMERGEKREGAGKQGASQSLQGALCGSRGLALIHHRRGISRVYWLLKGQSKRDFYSSLRLDRVGLYTQAALLTGSH